MKNQLLKPVFVSQDPAMKSLYEKVKLVARSSAPVIITGESGTGKEVLARLLHYHSPRSHNPFVALNCGALPEDIVQSELFGHEKGSFTGAVNCKKGCFEQADRGMLFLDEIGETSLQIQVKLLRAVELKNFRRVGGTSEIQTDVQIITATNRVMSEMMKQGKFREDLYYRLSVIELNIPSLRKRREDIPLLSEYFLTKILQEHGLPEKQFSNEFMTYLMNHDWPGNVRELRNVIERSAIMCTDSVIHTEYLPKVIGNLNNPIKIPKNYHYISIPESDNGRMNEHAVIEEDAGRSIMNGNGVPAGSDGTLTVSKAAQSRNNGTGINGDGADTVERKDQFTIPMGASMEHAERIIISRTLLYTDNNISEAARVLGVSRKTMHNKLARFNL